MFSKLYAPTCQEPRKYRKRSASSTFAETRRGVATVEVVLVLPIVLLIIFASVEFGRLNMLRHAVENAAYEGARHCIVPGATVAEATAIAQQHLDAFGTAGAQILVTPSPITEETNEITVRVTVSMDQNSWIAPAFTEGTQVQGSSTLRTERYRGITRS